MASITIKNIPDDLYARLKQAARAHHRSVNGELIHCLESVLKPENVPPAEQLSRLRRLREGIPEEGITPESIRQAIDQGRA